MPLSDEHRQAQAARNRWMSAHVVVAATVGPPEPLDLAAVSDEEFAWLCEPGVWETYDR